MFQGILKMCADICKVVELVNVYDVAYKKSHILENIFIFLFYLVFSEIDILNKSQVKTAFFRIIEAKVWVYLIFFYIIV